MTNPPKPKARRPRSKAQLAPAEIARRLAAVYGEPAWRPHGDPMTELLRGRKLAAY